MKKQPCENVRQLMALRELNLELAPEERELLETHLASCAGCRAAYAEERALSALLETHGERITEACTGLGEHIAARLPAAQPRSANRWLRYEAVAALVLFGAGLFVGTLLRPSPSAVPPPVATPGKALSGPTFLVGTSDNFAQEVLPNDRIRTSGGTRIVVPHPQDLENMLFELDVNSMVEDPAPTLKYR